MKMLRKGLLVCGVIASLLYVAIDGLAALRYADYHSFTAQAISELMANGAPTEKLVDPLFLLYDVLMMAFAVGVWKASPMKRAHVTAGLLLTFAIVGLTGPVFFEMNLRGSGPSTADVLHIAVTAVIGVFILGAVAASASIRGRGFRVYAYATLGALVLFGALTSFASRGLTTGDPTPWLGVLERLDIGAFLLWVGVLAVSFLRAPRGGVAPRKEALDA